MSLILMVTGQMISMVSPRVPAKIASVPMTVGKGQERTARVGLAFGLSRKNATWLTSLESHRFAMRVISG